MFSDKKIIIKSVFGMALATTLVGAASAQSLVVRSTGPSAKTYPAGTKLAANSTVTLRAQDRITVLDKAGTRVLSGPGNFRLDGRVSRDQNTTTKLASFINNRSRSRSRTGAVRGPGSGQTQETSMDSPHLWYLDVREGGTFCVANPNKVMLWRPDITSGASGTLKSSSGTTKDIRWISGNPISAWPKASIAIANGATFRLTSNVAPGEKVIKTVVLDKRPADLEEAAAVLIANGCAAQLDLLVRTVPAENSATGG